MSYKTILVSLNEITQMRCLLDSAAAIAADSDAFVVGLYAVPAVTLYLAGDIALPVEDDKERMYFQAREASVRGAFEEALAAAGLQGEFRVIDAPQPDVAPVVIEHGRQADLLLVGHSDSASARAMGADFTERVLIGAGRPTLVMPPEGHAVRPRDLALVAWNGSREAARAVFDSLPLLKRAEEVLIATVTPEGDGGNRQAAPSAALLTTLLRHGVRAAPFDIRSSGEAGLILLERAKSRGAGLLVMGGYGHARLREFILGGATRSVLREMSIPVLFSH